MSHTQMVKTLYKTILRLQRGLPVEIQELGIQYVRDEFKRHKNLKLKEDELLIKTFMWEWTNFAINLAKQTSVQSIQREEKLGNPLKEQDLDKFNDEQIAQLHELYQAASGKEEEDAKKS